MKKAMIVGVLAVLCSSAFAKDVHFLSRVVKVGAKVTKFTAKAAYKTGKFAAKQVF